MTLKYLSKPEEEEKENGGVSGLDILISPRKNEWGALDSSSQGKQRQHTPKEASPRPAVPSASGSLLLPSFFLGLRPPPPPPPPLLSPYSQAGPESLLKTWKERQ